MKEGDPLVEKKSVSFRNPVVMTAAGVHGPSLMTVIPAPSPVMLAQPTQTCVPVFTDAEWAQLKDQMRKVSRETKKECNMCTMYGLGVMIVNPILVFKLSSKFPLKVRLGVLCPFI